MQLTLDTDNLSELDIQVLALIIGRPGVAGKMAEAIEKNNPPAQPENKKTTPAKKAAAKPEPKPEPIAEEPLVEEPEPEEDSDETSDEDLLALAVKKATEIVAGGNAALVREALDAAGANRVRELNKDNVREFFKALS